MDVLKFIYTRVIYIDSVYSNTGSLGKFMLIYYFEYRQQCVSSMTTKTIMISAISSTNAAQV